MRHLLRILSVANVCAQKSNEMSNLPKLLSLFARSSIFQIQIVTAMHSLWLIFVKWNSPIFTGNLTVQLIQITWTLSFTPFSAKPKQCNDHTHTLWQTICHSSFDIPIGRRMLGKFKIFVGFSFVSYLRVGEPLFEIYYLHRKRLLDLERSR